MTVGPPRHSAPYPFARLDYAKARAAAAGIDLIDFGVGDPRDDTPPFIRQALADAITPASSYSKAAGIEPLRTAISNWMAQRFGVAISSTDILPTLGSKEIIHSLPAYVLTDTKDTVVVPSLAYPVYARGAHFHGANVIELPLQASNGFLPDLSAVAPEVWERTALLWVNYPNNPTGFTAPLSFYEEAATLARTYDFILASDEAYSEVWFDRAPVSALQTGADHVVVVNTLSKRSCMTGYRSGFIAGDPSLINRVRTYRPSVGVTPQDFVQHAAAAAWSDEDHVDVFRERWLAKRNVMLSALAAGGLQADNDATFFLWIATPAGHTSEQFAETLLQLGIVVSPGTIFGPEGEGFVRMALVPTLERCQEAADRLLTLFGEHHD